MDSRSLAAFVVLPLMFAPSQRALASPPPSTSSSSVGPPGPADGLDWVQTRSGEWLRGKLIAVDDNMLRFDSSEFDKQSIDWDDVTQLYTSRLYVVVAGLNSFTGTISMRDGTVEVLPLDGRPLRFSRALVHRIVVSGARERDHWYVDLTFGFDATSGNSNSANLTGGFGFGRVGAKLDFHTRYDGTWSTANDELAANRHRATTLLSYSAIYDVALVPALALVQRDAFRNIAVQVTPASAIRWDAINLPKLDWSVGTGAGYVYNLTVSSLAGEARDSHNLGILLFAAIDWEATRWLDIELSHQTVLIPTLFDLTNHHFRGELRFEITQAIDIDFAMVWDQVDKPLTNAEGVTPLANDFQFISSISLEFGAVH